MFLAVYIQLVYHNVQLSISSVPTHVPYLHTHLFHLLPVHDQTFLVPGIDILLTMTDSEARQIDSGKILEMEVAVKLLMDHSNTILKEERAHTNEKLTLITAGIGNNIANVTNILVKKANILEEKQADTELKLDTVTCYQEQLLHSLKIGIQDAFNKTERDIKYLLDSRGLCSFCDNVFKTQKDLHQHIASEHCRAYWYPCVVCGKTFPTPHEVNNH